MLVSTISSIYHNFFYLLRANPIICATSNLNSVNSLRFEKSKILSFYKQLRRQRIRAILLQTFSEKNWHNDRFVIKGENVSYQHFTFSQCCILVYPTDRCKCIACVCKSKYLYCLVIEPAFVVTW